jgi:quinol-cytochrome oxidoreductase complex cytochrome b subunit
MNKHIVYLEERGSNQKKKEETQEEIEDGVHAGQQRADMHPYATKRFKFDNGRFPFTHTCMHD